MIFKKYVKPKVRKLLDYYFGRTPKPHRIPFGPLQGENIFMSFNDSPAMFWGYHELKLLKLAEKYINKGDIVYDVGAHVGYNCLFYSRMVSDNESVHAFELIPNTANMLNKTIKNANKQNIIIHNIGLGSDHIKKDFCYDDRQMGSFLYKIENFNSKSFKRYKSMCEVYPLDEYVSIYNLEPPDFIKVDIEGAEIEFLNGAIDTITKNKPDMIIEFRDIPMLESGYKFLNDKGYIMLAKDGKKVNKFLINNLSSFYEDCFCFAKGKYKKVVF